MADDGRWLIGVGLLMMDDGLPGNAGWITDDGLWIREDGCWRDKG